MTTDELEALLSKRRRGVTLPWWFAGAIMLGFILLGALSITLVIAVLGLESGAETARSDRQDLARKVGALTTQVAKDRGQKAYDDAVIAAKDARIRQLTDALLRAKVPVPSQTYVVPSLAPTPQSTPSGGPTASPQPQPTVTVTRTPSPTPSPSPSGVCRLLPILC